jgi:hypothetical protein
MSSWPEFTPSGGLITDQLSLVTGLGEVVLCNLKSAYLKTCVPQKNVWLVFKLCVAASVPVRCRYLQYSLDVNGLVITIRDTNEASAYSKIDLLHW